MTLVKFAYGLKILHFFRSDTIIFSVTQQVKSHKMDYHRTYRKHRFNFVDQNIQLDVLFFLNN